MIKEKRKKFLISTLGLVCALTAVVGVRYAVTGVNAQEAELDAQLQSTYTLGQSIVAPKATLSYNGKSYSAVSYLTYPSGTMRSANNYSLDEAGLYILEYKAIADDGKLLEESRKFTVSDVLYSVSSERSSVYYGSHQKYAPNTKGIVVSLANGDVFTYNKVVDLKEKNYTDGLVSFFNAPEIEGIQDAKSLIVRFTDLYDEDNYFEVDFHTANNAAVTAGPLDAPKVGLEKSRSSATDATWTLVTFENKQYRMFQGDTSWGTPLTYRMQSSTESYTLGEKCATVCYDYDTKQVYAKPTSTYLENGLVADLDSDVFFKNNWKGFTTGETIVSIYGKGYNSSAMNFVITDVNGDDLTVDTLEQSVNTIIDVDTLGYDEQSLPFGIVGERYNIFAARLTAPFVRTVKFETKVYINYYSNKVEIPTQDGYFIPTLAGDCTIEYTATDSFGVKTIKTLDIEIKPSTTQNLALTLQQDGVQTGNVFDVFRVPSVKTEHVSGNVSLEVTAIAPSGQKTALNIDEWTFIPTEVGTYTIQYKASDYILSTVLETQINVVSVNAPKFLSDPILNSYYIKGATYETPTLFAHYIKSGKTEQTQAQVYVSYNNGSREQVGEKFAVQKSGQFALIYVAEANGASVEKTYALTAIDVGYGAGNSLHVHDYFQTNQSVSGEKGTYKGESAPVDGNVKFDFIHSVGAWNFSIDMIPHGLLEENLQSYDCLELTLTDSENPSSRLTVALTANGNQTQVLVNGRYQVTLNKAFAHKKFSIGYEESSKTVTFDLSNPVEVLLNADESMFAGFPSKKVFVSFTLRNVRDAYVVQVTQINNHQLTSRSDGVDPSVYFEGIVANTVYAKQDVITIPRFYVEDVVDIMPSFEMSVKDPDGNFVTSVDNVLLDGTQDLTRSYEVRVEQVGVYKCWYKVQDYAENGGRLYVINYTVQDFTPPTVSLSKTTVEYSVEDTITIAKVTATDDESENCIIEKFVKSPSNYYEVLSGDTFKATEKGVYRIFYFVYDEAKNLTVVKYDVTVD